MSTFGEKLKYLREKKGETQEDIAKLLEISRATVSKYESCDREPDIETIKTLAKHFDVTVDYIFGLTSIAGSSKSEFDQLIDFSAISPIEEKYKDPDLFLLERQDEIDKILKDKRFIRLALKIKESELDIDILDNIVNSIILLKRNRKHP